VTFCGFSHLADAAMFWWPAYRLAALVKVGTAIVSVATLVALFPLTRRALTLPATGELLARLREQTSAQARSQQELRLREEQLRAAALASGVGLWTWQRADDRMTWDAVTQAISGLDAGSPAGRDTLLQLVHEDDRGMVEAALRDCVQEGTALAVTFRARRHGGIAHLVARGAALRDDRGRITGLAGALLDVTDEELSRHLFRIAVEASPNAMLIVNRHGGIVMVNAESERLFGYSRSELLGSAVDRLVPAPAAARHAALRRSYADNPTERRMGADRELTALRKDGREVPVEIALAPVELAEGPGALATIVDVAERRQLRAKLSQAERLAAIGELAAGVAHEINNPVNTIVNCAQLVLDGDPAEENCKVMLEEGARITAIVKDLLQFARDDRGGPQPTNLAEVAGRCVRLLGENIKRHGIAVGVDVPATLPLVHGNPQQLQQVLLNLMINAKDAVQQRAPANGRRIDIVARELADGRIACSVQDNGPGVPVELHDRIFEPFVTTKRARGGTGLGLSVSRSIVTQFGGTIELDSVPGEYARFTMVLDRARTEGDPRHDGHDGAAGSPDLEVG
jgi:PAS domain S-box-containing protein